MAMQKTLGEAIVNVRATVHGMKDLNDLRNVLQNFGNGLPGFSGNMANAGNALQLAAEASRVTLRNMRHLSFAMRDAGRQALGFATALAAGFAPIIYEGARFEQAVANVRSVIGELREDSQTTTLIMADLSAEFIRLGEISEFSSVQVAEAAKALALAGFSAMELKDALPTVVNLASASGTELGRTAEIVANVARAFTLEASNFTRVGDILTQTFTNSNTTLETLAETMKILAPTASNLGLSLEETAAAVGVLGNAGVRGSLAGTGLGRVFNQLNEKAKEFDEILQGLGSSFDKIDLSKNALVDVVREFERIKKISNEDFTGLAGLFDERATRAFITLINQGGDSFERLLKLNQASAGVADAVRKIRLDTLAGDAERLKSNFQSLLSETFAILQPRLREIVQGFIWLVDSIRAVVRENPNLISGLARIAEILITFAAPIGLVLLGFGKMVAFVSGFFSLGVAISSAQVQFALLQTQMQAATAQSTALAAAMTRVKVAAILFRTVMVGAIGSIAVTIGALIGLQINNWLKAQAMEAYKATDAYKALNAEVQKLATNTRKATTAAAQETNNIRQAIELLQKGTNLTEKDRNELRRLTGSASGLEVAEDPGNAAAVARFREVNDQISALNEKSEKLANTLNRQIDTGSWWFSLVYDPSFSGRKKTEAELESIQNQIKALEEERDAYVKGQADKKKALEDFELARKLFLSGNKNLAESVDKDIASLEDLRQKIEDANIRYSVAGDTEEKAALSTEINKLLKEREEIQRRLQLTSPMLGGVGDENFLAQANGNVERAIELQKQYVEAMQAKAKADQEALEKLEALKEAEKDYGMTLDGIDGVIEKGNETLQEKIEKIREVTQEQLNYLKAALAVAEAEGNMSDVLRIQNLERQLQQKSVEDQKKLIDDSLKSQEESLDGLKLEQAQRQKNFAEFEKMKRKVGMAAIDKESSDLFQLTGDPVQDAQILARQKEFVRLKQEELDLDIKQTKTEWDAEAKKEAEAKKKKTSQRTREVKERSDIEKEVLKSLAGQAKNAKELAYFMMLIHQLEKKREQQLFASQRKAFRAAALLEALERRRQKLELAGQDTSKVDLLIRRKKNEFLLRDALLRQREKEAGVDVGGTGFDPDKIRDLSLPGLPDSINTALNTINAMFMGAPKLWVDSFLLQWSLQAPRLLQAVSAILSRISLTGGLPMPASSLTSALAIPGIPATAAGANILNMTINYSGADPEMKKLRDAIRKSLNSAGFTT